MEITIINNDISFNDGDIKLTDRRNWNAYSILFSQSGDYVNDPTTGLNAVDYINSNNEQGLLDRYNLLMNQAGTPLRVSDVSLSRSQG